jgi:2-haloacid dehalogenase
VTQSRCFQHINGHEIMSLSNVKALRFDTGGTILDWHTGMRTALATVGARYGIERDWAKIAK